MSMYGNESLPQPGGKVTDEVTVREMESLVEKRAMRRMSRRNFLTSAGVAAGATGALVIAGCGGSSTTTTPATTTPVTTTPVTTTPAPPAITEIDVLNFALNLEYLEASFYLYVTTGSGLMSADMGSGAGTVTGGAMVSFSDPNVAALANQLAADEQSHVQFVRTLITNAGSTPVPMPSLNLAALGTVNNDATFLAMARQLETVGVSAYEGGVGYFVADIPGLQYAATIHDTEAQHEGALRQFCIAKGITSGAVDSQDIPPTMSAVFNTNAMGLNAVRTPSQVLQIVYGAAGQTGVSKGGFYPNGLNGTITTS